MVDGEWGRASVVDGLLGGVRALRVHPGGERFVSVGGARTVSGRCRHVGLSDSPTPRRLSQMIEACRNPLLAPLACLQFAEMVVYGFVPMERIGKLGLVALFDRGPSCAAYLVLISAASTTLPKRSRPRVWGGRRGYHPRGRVCAARLVG